jgi:hypothetical protein
MKTFRPFLLACVAMFLFSGCLQIEKVVKLKPDGSGTVEETLVMTKSAIESIKQMAAGFGGDKGGGAKPFDLFDEAKIKEAGEKMGEGVTLVSATKISTEKGEGYKAIYAFTDINKLKVDQNPSSSMPSPGGGMKKEDKKEPVAFKFDKGNPASLTVTMPQPEFKPKKEPQPEGAEDMAMQMAQQMFKDMRVTLAIEVAGEIKQTNAEYRDGARVTLMDMDMNKLLANPAKFKELAKANPQSLQETKALLKGLDGVKVEAAPEVKISFQ